MCILRFSLLLIASILSDSSSDEKAEDEERTSGLPVEGESVKVCFLHRTNAKLEFFMKQ